MDDNSKTSSYSNSMPWHDDDFDDDGPVPFEPNEMAVMPLKQAEMMEDRIHELERRNNVATYMLLDLQQEVLTQHGAFGSDREFRMKVSAEVGKTILVLGRGRVEKKPEQDAKYPGGE